MFAAITAINNDELHKILTKKISENQEQIEFEIRFLKQLILHSENLLRSIDETSITAVVKKQIIKVTSN